MTPPDTTSPDAHAARYLAVADAIGRDLAREAIWDGDRCNWMVWSMEAVDDGFRGVYRAAPPDLYNGTAGIAFFLAHLAPLTGDRHQADTAAAALRLVLARLAEPWPAEAGVGGYHVGRLGVAAGLARVGRWHGDDGLVEAGARAAEAMAGTEPLPAQFDLLCGAAGAIVALLDVAALARRPALLDAAARLGHWLVGQASRQPQGLAWVTGHGETRPLVGLSHGTAGVALALLELYRLVPEPVFRDTALAALAYERAQFDPARRGWPDFRAMPGQPPQPPTFPVAWCHGATGIGLSRVRLATLLPDDPLLLPELDAAAAAVVGMVNQPLMPGTDFSPCHGVAANGEFLLDLARHTGRPEPLAAARQVAEAGIALAHQHGLPWGCGVPGCGETVSFMLGTAGIGHFYLRLADPRVPSLLVPPVAGDPAYHQTGG